MGECWLLEECRHESFPLEPQITLQPETTSSKHHRSGFFCQSTNPPISSVLFFTSILSSDKWKSDALILTCPVTHILCTEFNAAGPPVAAIYCCTIYFAVEASYIHIIQCNNHRPSNQLINLREWIVGGGGESYNGTISDGAMNRVA